MNRAYWCVAATVVSILASQLFGAERRLLEPEEFAQDGKPLRRYPYFKEDATGWYARETNCRSLGGPGKGYSAAIHEGSTQRVIEGPLQRPLPPGKYQIFLSSAGLYWQDKPNVVRIRLGAASADVSWTQIEKRIRWMPRQQIELKALATTIALEAVQFGGKGFSKLYDINSRCILIDQIYLTSDLTEKTGPTAAGAHVVRGDRAAPAETIGEPGSGYREVNPTATPSPVAEPDRFPIRLTSVGGRANLIPNSSFELGGGDGWCSAHASRSQAVHVFSEADHVRDAFHGQYAMRLPGRGVGGMQYSRVFELPVGGTYTLSGYVKAVGDGGGKLNLRITPIGKKNQFEEADSSLKQKRPVLKAETQTTARWQRFSVTGPLEAGPVVMAVNGACLLDAVQLEQGDQATDYAPRAALEASLSTDQLGHILYADKPTELLAWAHNSGAADATAALKHRIVDVRDRVIKEKTLSIPVPAGKTVSKRVVVSPTRRGLFNVVYAAGGRPYAEGELIYAVLPPIPDGMPRHALACNMDNDPASFELMKRMGHKWQLYCKLYADRPDQVNPKPGEYHWDALGEVVTRPRPFGMKTMPALLAAAIGAAFGDVEGAEKPIHVGTQKQLFIDDYVVESMLNVRRTLHQPVKHEGNPIIELKPPQPVGSKELVIVSGSVLYDTEERLFKMWYEGANYRWSHNVVAYATSKDGICWDLPNLAMIEYLGSKANNVVFERGRGEMAPGVFKDLAAKDPTRRYKMIYKRNGGVGIAFSPDGTHWTPGSDKAVIPLSDSPNSVAWDAKLGKYVAHTRLWSKQAGQRQVLQSESEDFVHWKPRGVIMKADEKDPPDGRQFYCMEWMPYEGAYLGFIAVYHVLRDREGKPPATPNEDKVDVQLAFSRDGRHWSRAGDRKVFLPTGQSPEDFDWGMVFVMQHPVVVGDEVRIYYVGFRGLHWATRRKELQGGAVGLARLRLDGFLSVHAPRAGGELLTKPLIFDAKRLVVNFTTSATGSIRVEIQDAEGTSEEGFSLADCPAIRGDAIERTVTWEGGSDLSRLAGRPVRLRFAMNDADLYAIRFEE